MPRRATKTSYGREQGNTPVGGDKGGGAKPKMYYDRLRIIAERAKTLKSVESILENPNHPQFARVWAETMDRGFGKVPSNVDLTSGGKEVSALLALPPEQPTE